MMNCRVVILGVAFTCLMGLLPCYGQDTLRIHPEVLKSIQEGTFLNLTPHRQAPVGVHTPLSITKDFSEYIQLEDTFRRINPHSLPPSVFMLHQIAKKESELKVNYEAFRVASSVKIDAATSLGFSMEDVLQQIFWKSARDKRHNRKHANAWKYYNSYPGY